MERVKSRPSQLSDSHLWIPLNCLAFEFRGNSWKQVPLLTHCCSRNAFWRRWSISLRESSQKYLHDWGGDWFRQRQGWPSPWPRWRKNKFCKSHFISVLRQKIILYSWTITKENNINKVLGLVIKRPGLRGPKHKLTCKTAEPNLKLCPSQYLSDPSSIIVYLCHWITHSVSHQLMILTQNTFLSDLSPIIGNACQ